MSEYGKPTYYNNGIIRPRGEKYLAEYNHHNTRKRKTFSNGGDAKAWIDLQNKAVKASGLQSRVLSVPAQEDAIRATQLANGHISLTDAVDFWLKHNKSKAGSKTIGDYYTQYLNYMEKERNASRDYLRDIRSRVGGMAEKLNGKKLNEITTANLQAILDEKDVLPETKRKFANLWQTFFNAAIKDHHLAINPATALYEKEKGQKKTRAEKIATRKKPEILSLPDTRKFFSVLEKDAQDLVIPMALSFFAGLRTEEILRMKYEYIHLGEEMEIDVKDSVTKTGEQRFVKIQANLAQWLILYGKNKGDICSQAEGNERIRLRRLERGRKQAADKAGVIWVHNAGRHSFASYHFRGFENEYDTVQQLGHESLAMFRNHYKNTVRHKKDALAYWKITPSASESKTIPLRRRSVC